MIKENSKLFKVDSTYEEKSWRLLERLFPIYRTILGEGFKQSLEIIKDHLPITTLEFASGSKCGSWTIPKEWIISDAYIADPEGNKIVDFHENSFCIWQYSQPFSGQVSKAELLEHCTIVSSDAIPLSVTFYEERWGFNISKTIADKLVEGKYKVMVKTELKDGVMRLGELYIPGKRKKEILVDSVLSCSSLANNLSGPVLATMLGELLQKQTKLEYSYRILFTPETIGPIALHYLREDFAKDVVGGFNLINLADDNYFRYKQSRSGDTIVDKAMAHALLHSGKDFEVKKYDVMTGECGNEKAYNSLGIEIPVGTLQRSPLGSYPEYDTSQDNLLFVNKGKIFESLQLLWGAIQAIERSVKYEHTFEGEPFLTGYGLFPKIESDEDRIPYDYLMGFANGELTLVDIADKSGLPVTSFDEPVELMKEKGLIKKYEAQILADKHHTVHGERIYLRSLTLQDASEDYCAWLNDSEVNVYLETRESTIEGLKEYIQKQIDNPNSIFVGVFDKENNTHIGNIKLEPIEWHKKRATFGILIGNKDYWGKGIGTEATQLIVNYAFDKLDLVELELGVIEQNKKAIRVYEKIGFKTVNVEKDSIKHGDTLYNHLIMTIKKKFKPRNSMNFGDVKRIIVLGGTSPMVEALKILQNKNVEFYVFSSERHLKEKINGQVLEAILKALNISFFDSPDINNDEKLKELVNENTIAISFSSAWIIKQSTIDLFGGKIVNLHETRLPQNRGGGGCSWQILRGNKLGACTLHLVDAGIDSGDIIMTKEFIYPETCKKPIDYTDYYFHQDKEFVEIFFDKILNHEDFLLQNQNENFSSYWPRLNTKLNGFIDWSWELRDIYRFICAFDDPYDGASSYLNGKRVYFKDCLMDVNYGEFHPFQIGLVFRINFDAVFIATKTGTIIVKTVLDEQGKDIKSNVRVGDRFITPQNKLEEAISKRIVYTAKGLKNNN
jgi:aminopeptidase-like protein/methionyl-tRNA formyltransferase/RimJ/RimL family protein N-acetyltransferase